jgi:hypothetical protein
MALADLAKKHHAILNNREICEPERFLRGKLFAVSHKRCNFAEVFEFKER